MSPLRAAAPRCFTSAGTGPDSRCLQGHHRGGVGAGDQLPQAGRRHLNDGVLNRNRRPLAKVVLGSDGQPLVLWSMAETPAGLVKADLEDLSGLMPLGAVEPQWSL